MSGIDSTLVSGARAASGALALLSPLIEAGRRLPPEAVEVLKGAGVFKLLVPRELGGSQASAPTMLAVLEEIARGDGSAGWCSMVGATSGLMSVYLDESTAREIYAAPDAITCGVFAPMGRAVAVEGGFRVSGRWPFASGCEHSGWRMGGALLAGATPDLLPSGGPNVRSMLFRADETRVIDTWDTSGLRGTGSHDIEVSDVFVPASRSFSLITGRPRIEGYALPFFGVLASGVAAVALGIARSAVDTFTELARTKLTPGSKRTIAHRELVQLQVAQAEARIRAGRAFLYAAVGDVEAEVAERGEASLRSRALLRLAASHATTEAAAAVDLAYNNGGAAAVYSKNPLQRHFRDVHVATQHLMVSATAATVAGRVLRDLETETSTL
jgi:indole-3-acetate monooxygenase